MFDNLLAPAINKIRRCKEDVKGRRIILATGEKPVRLWHLGPILVLRTDFPCIARNYKYDNKSYCGI
jgi:hypothetical protein